jgi:hypothetical protein
MRIKSELVVPPPQRPLWTIGTRSRGQEKTSDRDGGGSGSPGKSPLSRMCLGARRAGESSAAFFSSGIQVRFVLM